MSRQHRTLKRGSRRPEQMRTLVAQEAARIMAEEGVESFAFARQKAMQRIGQSAIRCQPGNQEIERALQEFHRLYRSDSQPRRLRLLRERALEAMEFLEQFNPRAVGPVVQGTAGEHSPVRLHLFADTPEEVALFLRDTGIPYETLERRLRMSLDDRRTYCGYRFLAGDVRVEITVFPAGRSHQAPLNPVDDKPAQRVSAHGLRGMLRDDPA